MPNIRQYESPIDKINPSEAGSEAFAQEGRHVRAVYQETGNQIGSGIATAGNAIVDDVSQQEASSATNQYAQTFATLSQSWNKAASTADPSDTHTAENWRNEVLEPALEKFGGDFVTKRGQEMSERIKNELRLHFTEKTIGDQSTMAGLAVTKNLTEASNALSQAAYADPTSFEDMMRVFRGTMRENIAASGVTADKAAQIDEQFTQQTEKRIAVAAAQSMAERNPAAFKEQLASGRFNKYFSGEEAASLDKYADTFARTQQEQQRSQEAETKRQNKEAADSAASQLTASLIQQDGTIKVTPDYFKSAATLAKMPDISPGLVKSMIDMGQAVTREQERGVPAVTDPHTYEDLRNRLSLPAGAPNSISARELYQDRANGLLSDKDLAFYKGAVEGLAKDPQKAYAEKRFNEFLASVKPSFIPKQGAFSLTGGDPRANQRWYQFQHDARDAFENSYSQGKWQDALNPSSGNFLGRMASHQILNQKGASPAQQSLFGVTQGGYRFTGHTPEEWKDKSKWVKVNG